MAGSVYLQVLVPVILPAPVVRWYPVLVRANRPCPQATSPPDSESPAPPLRVGQQSPPSPPLPRSKASKDCLRLLATWAVTRTRHNGDDHDGRREGRFRVKAFKFLHSCKSVVSSTRPGAPGAPSTPGPQPQRGDCICVCDRDRLGSPRVPE